jgi:hypothetical protein
MTSTVPPELWKVTVRAGTKGPGPFRTRISHTDSGLLLVWPGRKSPQVAIKEVTVGRRYQPGGPLCLRVQAGEELVCAPAQAVTGLVHLEGAQLDHLDDNWSQEGAYGPGAGRLRLAGSAYTGLAESITDSPQPVAYAARAPFNSEGFGREQQGSGHGVIFREWPERVLISQERCPGIGFGRRSCAHTALNSDYGPSGGSRTS